MTWEIALGIFALSAFVLSIVTMVSKMTSAVTKLTESVDNLKKVIDEMRTRSHETHAELYRKVDELREGQSDHETRIQILESREVPTGGHRQSKTINQVTHTTVSGSNN